PDVQGASPLAFPCRARDLSQELPALTRRRSAKAEAAIDVTPASRRRRASATRGPSPGVIPAPHALEAHAELGRDPDGYPLALRRRLILGEAAAHLPHRAYGLSPLRRLKRIGTPGRPKASRRLFSR